MLIGATCIATPVLEIATSLTLLAMTAVIAGRLVHRCRFCVATFAAAKGLAALPFIYGRTINPDLFFFRFAVEVIGVIIRLLTQLGTQLGIAHFFHQGGQIGEQIGAQA